MTRYTHRRVDLIAGSEASYVSRVRERLQVNVYMDGVTFSRLRAIAMEEEASVNTVVRELLKDALAARDLKSGNPA